MSHVTAGLPLVSQPLGLIGTSFRDRETSSVRFGHSEPHTILKPSGTEMPASRDIASLPNYVRIKGQDPMGPMLVPSNRSLKNKLVDLEEKPVMFGFGVRRLRSVGARQNDVANPDELDSFYWVRAKVS
ncbi:MAG: hypothetical protein M3T56_15075 [Chloroflexota bacterium]|nr:hypothetical protein [Chloroflexota bacterium]